MEIFIHATADVSSEASIGENTKVWHLAQIRESASIGENCTISKNVYIDTGVRIGNNVKIQNNVNIYNGVTIEDDVFLGPSMTFTNDLFPRATNADWIVTKTIVKKGASIGANATIVCGITIGEYAMVGAGAVVTKDVPDYTMVVGNPAKAIGKVCKCGIRMVNTHSVCDDCGLEI
jgi:acetyltransferase-like isoleucine patch superfamily enzyme